MYVNCVGGAIVIVYVEAHLSTHTHTHSVIHITLYIFIKYTTNFNGAAITGVADVS